MAEKDLSTLFGGKIIEELTAVVLSPPGVGKGATGTIPLGDNLPSDFEEIEWSLGVATNPGSLANGRLTPRMLADETASRISLTNGSRTATSSCSLRLDAASNSLVWTGTTNDVSANVFPYEVIGYKKKYATTNLSVVLPVNGGANIATNDRYEIPASALPANFLDENGNIKKNVQVRVEIFNNSGTGIADWGESVYSEKYNASANAYFSDGVLCGTVGSSIVVETGGSSILRTTSPALKNVFGCTSNIQATPCRVIATLAGEAYTVQTA